MRMRHKFKIGTKVRHIEDVNDEDGVELSQNSSMEEISTKVLKEISSDLGMGSCGVKVHMMAKSQREYWLK